MTTVSSSVVINPPRPISISCAGSPRSSVRALRTLKTLPHDNTYHQRRRRYPLTMLNPFSIRRQRAHRKSTPSWTSWFSSTIFASASPLPSPLLLLTARLNTPTVLTDAARDMFKGMRHQALKEATGSALRSLLKIIGRCKGGKRKMSPNGAVYYDFLGYFLALIPLHHTRRFQETALVCKYDSATAQGT